MTYASNLLLVARPSEPAAPHGHVAVVISAGNRSKHLQFRAAIARMIASGGGAGLDERELASALAGAARRPGYLAEHDEQRAAAVAIGLATLQGLGPSIEDRAILHVDLASDYSGWRGIYRIGEHRAPSREPETPSEPSVAPGEVLCSFLAPCHPAIELRAPGKKIYRLGAAWRPEDVPSNFNIHGIGDHDALTQTALARIILAGQDAATAQTPAVLGALGWIVMREGAHWSDALRQGGTCVVVDLFRDALYFTARWRFEPIRVETPPEPPPLPKPAPRCARCGTPYTATRSDARYCGSSCKQAAYRERKATADR